jgi:DNA-binding IclR family transcriptional regulator
MSHSSVHHYLATLRQYGYVVKTDNTYDVGPRFLTLGGYARNQNQLYRLAKQKVDELAAELGGTTRLVVESHGVGITFYQATPRSVTEPKTYEGYEDDLHATAAGKAILAEHPPERVEELLGNDLPEHTESTITDRDELLAELEQIREQDYAHDDEEVFEGVTCIASSIVASDRRVLGAISVSVPTGDIDEETFRSKIPPALQNATGTIGINHTYSSWQNE